MAFNREQFKAARVDVNKQVAQQADQVMKTASSRGDYHPIDTGANIFRLFPPHPSEVPQPSMQPKVVYWLECKVPSRDDNGNEIEGKFEYRSRPIFDSRVHGGTEKDIINEYIDFTRKQIYGTLSKDEAQKKLWPINGYRDTKTKKWVRGILSNKSFVCYATKGTDITKGALGRLEMYEGDKDLLEALNIDSETGQPIETDIFSDPNDGVQFIIIKKQNPDTQKWETTVQKRDVTIPKGATSQQIGQIYDDFIKSQIIPDEVLEFFLTMEPLEKQFKNAYHRSDFTKALEALQHFDEKHGFNTFDNDEFLLIVEEIDKYYPEDDGSPEEDSSSEPVTSTTTQSNEKVNDGDIENMTREELKKYIEKNKLGIKIFSSMTEEVIRDMIVDAESDQAVEEVVDERPIAPNGEPIDPLPFDKEVEEAETKKVEEKQAEEQKPQALTGLRARMAAAKAEAEAKAKEGK